MAERNLIHLKGHKLCVIDVETTGLDPSINEIIQICILPLNSDFEPSKEVPPFYAIIKPENQDAINPKAMQINQMNLFEICKNGIDTWFAQELLDEWFEKLNLGYGKKIAPLAMNWPFDRSFIQAWLGNSAYEDFFHYHYRDTMVAAHFLNDVAAFNSEEFPFPKQSLKYLCSQLGIENKFAHDAMQDCLATAKVWKRMVKMAIV